MFPKTIFRTAPSFFLKSIFTYQPDSFFNIIFHYMFVLFIAHKKINFPCGWYVDMVLNYKSSDEHGKSIVD
jgi:hypothetical protein